MERGREEIRVAVFEIAVVTRGKGREEGEDARVEGRGVEEGDEDGVVVERVEDIGFLCEKVGVDLK